MLKLSCYSCLIRNRYAETLSLTVEDFIKGTLDYHFGGSLNFVLEKLDGKNDVAATFYLKGLKQINLYNNYKPFLKIENMKIIFFMNHFDELILS